MTPASCPHGSRAAWLGLAAGAVLCAFFAVIGARQVWPPMDGDAAMLFPAAIELARGNGFVNTPWIPPLNDTIDGPGGRRYISHGFLNPLLVGLAAQATGGDAPAAVAWLYVLTWLAAVAAAAGLVVWWRDAAGFAVGWQFLTGFLATTGMFALAFKWFGRMESLAMLWVALAVLTWALLPGVVALAAAGACVGLLVFTSPVSGVLGLMALGAAMVLRPNFSALSDCAAVVLGGLAASTFSLLLYPYPVADWIGGTIRHSRIHFDHPSFQGFVSTWLASPHLPLLMVSFGVLLMLATGSLVAVLAAASPWRRWASAGALLVVGFLVFRLAFMRSEAAYNTVPLFPLLGALALASIRRRGTLVAVLAAFLLPTTGLFRASVLLAAQADSGPSYEETRTVIARHLGHGLTVAKGLWLAVPDLGRVRFGMPPAGGHTPRWFLDQQLASGREEPKSYPGYRLVENRFTPRVGLWGWPVSRTPTGWQYALYERDDASSCPLVP